MERYRRKKLIIIIALILTISGLSIGFAAFTSALTISSTASVKPDESSFSVLFSSSGTTQATAQITPTVSGATGDKATISGTTISGLKANFTAPGQSVTYKFWSHNAGSYIAYLRNITYQNAVGESSFKVCTPGTGTTASLVTAACKDISVTVSVGSTSASDTVGVTNHPLGINAYEQVTVIISYSTNGDLADGPFDIKFGDITLNYGSADVDVNEITFNINGIVYTALEDMTWNEWVASNYNTDNFVVGVDGGGLNYYVGFEGAIDDGYVNPSERVYNSSLLFVYASDIIIENAEYGDGSYMDI